MNFLPIAVRELRIRSRLNGTYRVRCVAVTLAGLILAVGLPMGLYMGKSLLVFFSMLAFIFALIEGIRNTADSLSEEKREGTLGLLFLTDLKGYDVVLGKLAATSLTSFYVVFGLLPVLAFPLLMGGVTGSEVSRLGLVIVLTLLFSASLGMAMTSVARNARRAWAASLGLLAGMLSLGVAAFISPVVLPLGTWLAIFSPAFAYYNAFDEAYSTGPGVFWSSVGALSISAVLFTVFASWSVFRSWREGSERSTPHTAAGARVGAGPWHFQERRALLERNPALWLARRRMRSGFLWACTILAVAALLALVYIAGGSFAGDSLSTWFAIIPVVHWIFGLVICLQATHLIADARQSGALELWLSTPLTPGEMIGGQLEALRRQFFGPVSVLVLTELIVIAWGISGSEGAWIVLLAASRLVGFICSLFAFAYVGLWIAIRAKKSSRAVGWALAAAVGIPIGSMLLCVIPNLLIYFVLALIARSKVDEAFTSLIGRRMDGSTVASAGLREATSI